MRRIEIEIDDETFKAIEIRGAIDNLRPKEAIEGFLAEIVDAWREKRPVKIREGGEWHR